MGPGRQWASPNCSVSQAHVIIIPLEGISVRKTGRDRSGQGYALSFVRMLGIVCLLSLSSWVSEQPV